MASVQKAISNFRADINQQIDVVCTDIINDKLKNYEKVTKSFQKYFCQEDLGSILDRKADLDMITRLQD